MRREQTVLPYERQEPECLSTFSVHPFGTFTIRWAETEAGTRILRIMLPGEEIEKVEHLPQGTSRAIRDVRQKMQSFLKGDDVHFDVDILAFEQCSPFQKKVLLAEYGIPRGWVSTYSRIARHIGVPQGQRAVGNALATNPFPIIIPCHRAIRSDGRLGGFRGGQEMKRRLLELEGVRCSPDGRVLTEKIFY